MAKNSGQAAAMLSRAGSAVQMPAASGCTSCSKASRPNRRTANCSSDSSVRLRSLTGTNRSQSSRSRPRGDRSGVVRMLFRRPGAISRNPRGTACVRPWRRISARRTRGSTPMSSPASPTRSTSATASGRAARKLSAERSMSQPSRRTVSITPPTRPEGSISVTRRVPSWPAPVSFGGSFSNASAAARPAIPPPITTTCCQRGLFIHDKHAPDRRRKKGVSW